LKVADLDIPDNVKEILVERGFSVLYPPQEDALKTGVLEGRNLVLASPTASGKTLIAELCALKHVLERGGKVLYMTPLRALAWEKYETFQKYSEFNKRNDQKIKIGISTGDLDSSTRWLEPFDIVITTNEKCDSLLRHKAPWMNDVSLVIADEIHLIGGDRGPTLEVALARFRQIKPDLQILALSATIRNAEEVAEWLKADWVATDWRPVVLREGVIFKKNIIFKDGGIKQLEALHQKDALNIALNVILEGGQSLIFVESRRRSMSLAREAASALAGVLQKWDLSRLQEVDLGLLPLHPANGNGVSELINRDLHAVVQQRLFVAFQGVIASDAGVVQLGDQRQPDIVTGLFGQVLDNLDDAVLVGAHHLGETVCANHLCEKALRPYIDLKVCAYGCYCHDCS